MTMQICEVQKTVNAVVANLVITEARSDFLPKYFGSDFVVVEPCINAFINGLCKEYQAGSLNFYELSNGGMFAAPAVEKKMHLKWDMTHFEDDVSSVAAGIIGTLFTLNRMSFQLEDSDRFMNLYWKLYDYIDLHPEASEIYRAIDSSELS